MKEGFKSAIKLERGQTKNSCAMVEVFKTNVNNFCSAGMIIHLIHTAFPGYTANFDLDDCDKILRVESNSGRIEPLQMIGLLKDIGFDAEVLPDEVPLREVEQFHYMNHR